MGISVLSFCMKCGCFYCVCCFVCRWQCDTHSHTHWRRLNITRALSVTWNEYSKRHKRTHEQHTHTQEEGDMPKKKKILSPVMLCVVTTSEAPYAFAATGLKNEDEKLLFVWWCYIRVNVVVVAACHCLCMSLCAKKSKWRQQIYCYCGVCTHEQRGTWQLNNNNNEDSNIQNDNNLGRSIPILFIFGIS